MDFPEGFENLVKSPFEFTRELKFPPSESIRLIDTTLRDGEQCPGVAFTPQQKLEIAKALDEIGVHIIDVGFPATSPSDEEAFKLILNAKKDGQLSSRIELMLTCRANVKDADYVLRVLLESAAHPSEVTFFVFTAGSDLQVKYKLGKTLLKREGHSEKEWLDMPIEFYREANIKMLCEILNTLKERGVTDIDAGCAEDGSRSDVQYTTKLAQAAVKTGATRISFADTVGVMTPQSSAFYFSKLREALGNTPIAVHCHDDYGLATINSITALGSGATHVTVTVNGIGERAGNAALHSVTGSLLALYDIKLPDFKYEKLNSLSRMVENFSGIPLKVTEPIVGKNVFTHESGIHSAGVMIDPRIYGHIPPEIFGGQSKFLFGKHSGHHAVKFVLDKNASVFTENGILLDDDLVNRSVKMVKSIREKNQREKSSETIITRYYKVMDMLGIGEDELVKLALMIGIRRGW